MRRTGQPSRTCFVKHLRQPQLINACTELRGRSRRLRHESAEFLASRRTFAHAEAVTDGVAACRLRAARPPYAG